MLSTLTIVLPIFALIFAGWLVRRMGVLGPHATSELNRFVVYLALPALLFDIIANAPLSDIWQPGFIGAFGLGAGIVFVATVLLRLRYRPLADAAIDGLNASYANTGFVGFPLALAALGQQAMAPTLAATIVTVCVLFGIAIVLIETGLQTEQRRRDLVLKVGGNLVRNPLIIAPVLGAVFPVTGIAMPQALDSFLSLLGGAASPCALVALGLFLAQNADSGRSDVKAASLLVVFKLLAQPIVTFVLAVYVFRLSPLLTQTAVLMAALPTGTGPFMLAELYRREAGITSRVVLGSTVLSLLTIRAYLGIAAAR